MDLFFALKRRYSKIRRIDQAGEIVFPEFLMNAWKSGIVKYDVNFLNRVVVYYRVNGEEYKESYQAVTID